jgi:hypothetical protein
MSIAIFFLSGVEILQVLGIECLFELRPVRVGRSPISGLSTKRFTSTLYNIIYYFIIYYKLIFFILRHSDESPRGILKKNLHLHL